MLTNVARTVANASRKVVRRHPNAFECLVMRKQTDRSEPKNLGGIRVLSSEDEHDVSYSELGVGYALFAEQFQVSGLFDSANAATGAAPETRFLIVPEVAEGEEHWSPKKRDIFYLVFTDDIKLAYEIVGQETPLNISPLNIVWIANRVSDLDVLPGQEM